MKDYKSGSHAVWDCKYHLVWITKYRYPVLKGDVGERARELLREISRSLEMTIYAGAINRDHVHMLIGIPPHLSVSKAAAILNAIHNAVGVRITSLPATAEKVLAAIKVQRAQEPKRITAG